MWALFAKIWMCNLYYFINKKWNFNRCYKVKNSVEVFFLPFTVFVLDWSIKRLAATGIQLLPSWPALHFPRFVLKLDLKHITFASAWNVNMSFQFLALVCPLSYKLPSGRGGQLALHQRKAKAHHSSQILINFFQQVFRASCQKLTPPLSNHSEISKANHIDLKRSGYTAPENRCGHNLQTKTHLKPMLAALILFCKPRRQLADSPADVSIWCTSLSLSFETQATLLFFVRIMCCQ